MFEQPSLVGFDTAPQPTDRLFFAISPDVDTATRIARLAHHLRGEHGLIGTPLSMERFHVTLYPLGDYVGVPQDIVAAATEAAAVIAMPPFQIAFDRVVSFFGRARTRPFVLRAGDGAAGLLVLQQALDTSVRKAGLRPWVQRPYTPHMTLLYDELRAAEQAVETISWTVREFVLVHSLLGRARHVPLARWPLGGRLAEASGR